MARLTKRMVDDQPVPAPGTTTLIWDDDLAGFGLRVSPAGTKAFVLQYRAVTGQTKRMTIGRYGTLTVEQGRTKARELLADITGGGDPVKERKDYLAAPTVADLARDYLERHALPKKRPASIRDDRAMLDRIILPGLGTRKLAELGRRDIETLFLGLKATPYQANRMLALLSKMFSLAMAWGWTDANPAKGIERFQEDKRERWLDGTELSALTAVLSDFGNRRAAHAVLLLLLTGARRGEVLAARWDQFDLTGGVWVKPSSHTKQKRSHRVPLSATVRALLSGMAAERLADCPWLFPADDGAGPIGDIKNAWASITARATVRLWADQPDSPAGQMVADLSRRLGRLPSLSDVQQAAQDAGLSLPAGLTDVRLHDLRHTFASHLASGGVSLAVIGRLLGHTQAQTTQRYAHLADDPLRRAVDSFGSKLTRDDDAPQAEVVMLRKRHT